MGKQSVAPAPAKSKPAKRKPVHPPPEPKPTRMEHAEEKFPKLVALLKEHPGQTAIQLQHLGWRPEIDGELEEAQRAGLIAWVHGKWYAV